MMSYRSFYPFAYREAERRGTVIELVGGGLHVYNHTTNYFKTYTHAEIIALETKSRLEFDAEVKRRHLAIEVLQTTRENMGLSHLTPAEVQEHFKWPPLELPPVENIDISQIRR